MYAAPRTPYTPFTAFASKQNPFEFSAQQAGAQAHVLDARDDPLAGLYNTVLRFVDRDLRRLMEIAERVCAKSGSRARAGEAGGFEIMANVVWAEIGRAVLDELGGVVFAAGKPDDFRKVCKPLGRCWVGRLTWINPAPRDDTSVHPRARVPRTLRACHRDYACAPCACAVRAPLAAASVLPAAVERDRQQVGGSPCCSAPGADTG